MMIMAYVVKKILLFIVDDKSRCRLSTIPGESGSDYINASHINVSTRLLVGYGQILCFHQ